MSQDCIFCKIAAGQIPSRKVFEDDELLAFHDIHPWAPVHVLIIPKIHVATLADTGPEHEKLLGRMLALRPRSGRHNPSPSRSRFGSRKPPTARATLPSVSLPPSP